MRIAFGRVTQETHAFSPLQTTLEDFRRFHWLEADALLAAVGKGGAEIPGLLKHAELSGFARAARRARVELVPLFSVWSMPSGPLTDETVEALRDKLVRSLEEAGRVDGVMLSLHGAMRGTAQHPEPEEELLAAARAVVGPSVPIAITLDLHAQLTPQKVAVADILTAYRTNPHRDLPATGHRAGELLIRAAKGEIRPVSTWRSLPMVLGGGTTVDLLPPVLPVFLRLRAMALKRRVLTASLCMCHLWNDSPDLGWSVHVATDGDARLADELADELAERAWQTRLADTPRFVSVEEAVARTRELGWARRTGVICFTDASDVVGAGAPGDNTNIVAELLEHARGLTVYVPLRAPAAVAELFERPVGAIVATSVGGRVDPSVNPTIPLYGRMAGSYRTEHYGRVVVLNCDGVHVVLTELPPFNVKPAFWSDVGLSPWEADVLVVKSLFHFRLFHAPMMRKAFIVRTRGFTDLDHVLGNDFNDAVYPKDQVGDWRPADRRRRGLAPG